MLLDHRRFIVSIVLLAVIAAPIAAQNPITAVRDAVRKAQEELKRKQQDEARRKERKGEPAPGQPVVAGAPGEVVTLADLNQAALTPVTAMDWTAMPDLVGVHLHMPWDQAATVLRKQFPKHMFQTWPANPATEVPTVNKPVHTGATLHPPRDAPFDDQVNLSVTIHPNEQVVWRMRRMAQRQHVNRATLLAALRRKYGKEAMTAPNGRQVPADDDRKIMDLWWLFDERGKPVPPPASGLSTLTACQSAADQITAGQALFEVLDRKLDPWCASAFVAIFAELQSNDDPDIIETIRFEMINVPLALRGAGVTRAWRDGVLETIRRQELEKSKQNTPKL